MNWVDYTFIGIVVFSMLLGVWRGLVREAVSLALLAQDLRQVQVARLRIEAALQQHAVVSARLLCVRQVAAIAQLEAFAARQHAGNSFVLIDQLRAVVETIRAEFGQ